MGCLLSLLAGFAPRIALLFIWMFTTLVLFDIAHWSKSAYPGRRRYASA